MLVLGGVPSEFPKAFLEVEKHIPSSSQTYPSGRKLTIAPNLSKWIKTSDTFHEIMVV